MAGEIWTVHLILLAWLCQDSSKGADGAPGQQ